jgi:hypothetical protein
MAANGFRTLSWNFAIGLLHHQGRARHLTRAKMSSMIRSNDVAS